MELVTLTTATTAIATIFFTKVIEKPGENLGQLLWDKTQNLIGRLRGKSDNIAGLLEGTPQQPLDYSEAILELKALAEKDPELAQVIKEIEAEASKETNPEFQRKMQEVKEEANKLLGKEPIIQNSAKLADKINNLNQAQHLIIHQSNTF